MHRRLPPQLSFANVVSVMALFAALGIGTAWALERNSVESKHIVNGQVRSVDVENDGLGGIDINEDSLAQVPSAANGGQSIVFDHPNTDAAPVNILTLGEMTLKAQCFEVVPSTFLVVSLASTISSDINFGFVRRLGANDPAPFADGKIIGPGSTSDEQRLLSVTSAATFERAEGQLIDHNANRVLAVTFHAVANGAADRCQVTGVATPAPG